MGAGRNTTGSGTIRAGAHRDAKANPGKLNWGFGRNAGPHLLGELFVLATGIDVNRVPYRSGADAVPDMLGGRVQMNFGTIENLAPLVQEENCAPCGHR